MVKVSIAAELRAELIGLQPQLSGCRLWTAAETLRKLYPEINHVYSNAIHDPHGISHSNLRVDVAAMDGCTDDR
jgi:hypothetical protein